MITNRHADDKDEARRLDEWDVMVTDLAAAALGVDTGSDTYKTLEGTRDGEGYTKETGAVTLHTQTVSYLTGANPASTPEQSVRYFPNTVLAALIPLFEKHGEVLARIEHRPRQWSDGTIGPAEWYIDPYLDIALQAALQWLDETGGLLNPFTTKQRLRLEALAEQYLADIAELWEEPRPAPEPVDAHPIVSTGKAARGIVAVTGAGSAHITGGKGTRATASADIALQAMSGGRAEINTVHYMVSDGITALVTKRLEGGETFPIQVTATELTRHLLQVPKGTRTPEGATGDVVEAAETLRTTQGTFRGTDYEGTRIALRGALLHADWTMYEYRNGSVVEGWIIYALPHLTAYMDRLNQAKQADRLLTGLESGGVRPAAVNRFIAAHLILWGTPQGFLGGKHWYQLREETITQALGDAGHAASRKSIQKWTENALTHFQARGFITAWDVTMTGRKRTGFKVRLPEQRPPLTEHKKPQIGDTKK